MLNGLYGARYMLFAMGLMAVYAGLVYNDYFSIGLALFPTKWAYTEESGVKATSTSYYGDASNVYKFGVDPAWKISDNELLFYNSMKMKMSVILGIFQMTFGIILKGMNAIHFRNYVDFFCEFLPMIIFDLGLFGYMVILIFVKWSINWDTRMALGSCTYNSNGVIGTCSLSTSASCFTSTGATCNSLSTLDQVCPLGYGGTSGGCQPPNLITTLINIALKPGTVDEPMYAGQAAVQTVIILVAFICVPWLLFVKPYYLKWTHKPVVVHAPHHGSENPLLADEGEIGHANPHGSAVVAASGGGGHGDDHGHGGEFNFGEIFIHQAIETIEFVLGMVSNTASYLRLWALSLAHTELATVFWEKAMVSAISTNNPVFIFVGYAVFAAVTFGVLLAMDVLECFLHALRLHWVEFQNKFYKADGYRFQPFDFKAIIDRALLD
jgi:V-type H+-transporting ATPase subunit a